MDFVANNFLHTAVMGFFFHTVMSSKSCFTRVSLKSLKYSLNDRWVN